MANQPDKLQSAVGRLRSDAALPANARVIVLGPAPPASAFAGARGWTIERPADPGSLPYPDGSFDAAIVTDSLERLAWDRWVLQQLHRVLRDGAPLALAVPDLEAVLTGDGMRFVAGRLLGRIRRRFTRGAGPRPFAGRRYRTTEIVRVLEGLHYGLVRDPERGPGGTIELVARKQPGLAQRLRDGNPPEPAAFVGRFAQENARFERIRSDWVARHPGLAAGTCVPLDPAAHASARVLVLAPHADDELVGAAGTLLRLIRHGARVTVVHATDGGASAALLGEPDPVRTTIRLEEARAVGTAMGIERLEFWKQDNREFRASPELVERLCSLLGELQPDLIVTPFVTDIHPDHFTLNRILEQALIGAAFDASRCRMLYSEIWSLVPANACCDVTDVEEAVEGLITMYTTAMKVDDLPHLCESRYYYNSCRLLGRTGFAEAFYSAPATQHAALIASVAPLHG